MTMDDTERTLRFTLAAQRVANVELVRQNNILRDELAEARLLLSQECAAVEHWRCVVAAIVRRAGGELRIPRSDVVWVNLSEFLTPVGDEFEHDLVLKVRSANSAAMTKAAPHGKET